MPFLNKSEATKKKKKKVPETEKKTANVQMPRTVGVVYACQLLFALINSISNLQSNKLALVILHSKMSATDVR